MHTTLASEPAPAKINLDLIVTGQRFDGYHELDSLVVFTAFGDRLRYEAADQFELSIEGPFSAQTPIAANIILKASNLLAREFPTIRPLRFILEKNLPVASGIGGGSSDAAAAMRAIVRANNLTIDPECLRDMGSTLGADIPACLYGHNVRMRGSGLRLDPVRGLPEIPMVLVNPGIELQTADVFRQRSGPFSRTRQQPLMMNSSVTGLAVWLKESVNDLEAASIELAPDIAQILASIDEQDGVLLSRMSGSGATCFGIFTDSARADRAANRLANAHPDWWVVATKTLG